MKFLIWIVKLNFNLLILSSPLFLKAETKQSKIDILTKKINDFEEMLIKIGHPNKKTVTKKVGKFEINDVRFGKVSIINNKDDLLIIKLRSEGIPNDLTVLLFDQNKGNLIPVTTTLMKSNGRIVIGDTYMIIDQNLNLKSVIKDKEIKCGNELNISTNNYQNKIKIHFCAKPILNENNDVLGVYLVHIKNDNIKGSSFEEGSAASQQIQ